MDDQTLDRMLAAFEDSLRKHSSRIFPSLSDKRQAMLAALRAMWRPIDEAPKNEGEWIRLFEGDDELIGAYTNNRWHDEGGMTIDPTHFAPPLPDPENGY